jgi:transmembrane sensor
MSDTDAQTQIAGSIQTINSRAADWIIAKREHEWTDALQAELNAWLAQSPAHMVAYLRIDSAWSRADRLNALRLSATTPGNERLRPWFVRIAIGFAALFVVGVVAGRYVHLGEDTKTYSTALGGHAMITLNDGSRVELNTDTIVHISDKADERKVWLDKGEAYFEVHHDPAHPFLLSIGDQRVVDVGTKFTARRDALETRIAIAEGSVRFEPGASGKQVTLVRGDVLVATPQAISVSKESAEDIAIALGWRTGVVTFRHTTLADAAVEINRYDAKQIIVADSAARNMKISGTFPIRNATLFAHLVSVGLGLRIEDRNQDVIVISR